MILDMQTILSGTVSAAGVTTGQAITNTEISENVLDLRNAATPVLADEGILDTDLWLVVICTVAAAGADAAKTLDYILASDSTANLATSPTTHYTGVQRTGAQLTAGAVLARVKIPSGDYERYLGIKYTCSAAFTAFNILAFLTPGVDRNVIYPSGFTVDA